jgi:hypothetical protein
MALQAFPVKRIQDPPPPRSIYEIVPKNWRRYPGKVITKAMTDPAYIATVGFTGGTPNLGATSDNNGETGTAAMTNARGQPWDTQAAKATALGTTIAPDVGKSYHGTRGAIEPHEPYPSANAAVVAPAYRDSNFIAPGTP